MLILMVTVKDEMASSAVT